MIKFQLWLRKAFSISKSQSTGLIILLPLSLLIMLLPSLLGQLMNSEANLNEEVRDLDRLISQLKVDSTQREIQEIEYKIFDPNKVSEEELVSMGINVQTAGNWSKYLASGGSFDSAGDIKKIYGMNDSTYIKIKNYLRIENKEVKFASATSKKREKVINNTSNYGAKKEATLRPFDLNTADTVMFKRIRGIGSVYSNRIVKYRESLGGFVSKQQLKEVWGLKDSVLQQMDSLIYIDPAFSIRHIKVNQASQRELSQHPYLSNKQAGAIVAYRYQHGKFHDISDLYNIHMLDSLVIAKISPYLEL